jgi:hypothetical protein
MTQIGADDSELDAIKRPGNAYRPKYSAALRVYFRNLKSEI